MDFYDLCNQTWLQITSVIGQLCSIFPQHDFRESFKRLLYTREMDLKIGDLCDYTPEVRRLLRIWDAYIGFICELLTFFDDGFVFGGFLRDLLLGIPPKDLDFKKFLPKSRRASTNQESIVLQKINEKRHLFTNVVYMRHNVNTKDSYPQDTHRVFVRSEVGDGIVFSIMIDVGFVSYVGKYWDIFRFVTCLDFDVNSFYYYPRKNLDRKLVWEQAKPLLPSAYESLEKKQAKTIFEYLDVTVKSDVDPYVVKEIQPLNYEPKPRRHICSRGYGTGRRLVKIRSKGFTPVGTDCANTSCIHCVFHTAETLKALIERE